MKRFFGHRNGDDLFGKRFFDVEISATSLRNVFLDIEKLTIYLGSFFLASRFPRLFWETFFGHRNVDDLFGKRIGIGIGIGSLVGVGISV